MEKVKKNSYSECYTPSSEPTPIYCALELCNSFVAEFLNTSPREFVVVTNRTPCMTPVTMIYVDPTCSVLQVAAAPISKGARLGVINNSE
jgi:hypothetical protein